MDGNMITESMGMSGISIIFIVYFAVILLIAAAACYWEVRLSREQE